MKLRSPRYLAVRRKSEVPFFFDIDLFYCVNLQFYYHKLLRTEIAVPE